MSRGINKVILVGNLGKDPEVQNFETGKKATFSLATTETQRDRDGNDVQHTEWHNIVMWRGLADIAEQYLRKGSQVYLEGRIRTRSFEARDGQKKFVTEIQADNMVLLGSRREQGDQERNHSENNSQSPVNIQKTNISPDPAPGMDNDTDSPF
jgi:single-strand DNA-binding protein